MGALLPWRPFRELGRLSHDLEERFLPRRLFEWPFEAAEEEAFPPVESFIHNGQLVVRAELPGVDPKDVDISVLGDVLTIKGERKSKKEVKEENYIRREIEYGSFERRLTLPEGASTEKIQAQFQNGVVEITIPVAKELEARKIPVEIKVEK